MLIYIFFFLVLVKKTISMKKIILLLTLFYCSDAFAQVPSVPAPTQPARNASDVISIYGGAYTNISGVTLNPFWNQNTVVSQIAVAGDSVLQYANFNYQGTDWAGNAQNISNMDFLHVNIWTNNQAPNVYAISSGPEIAHPITSQPGSWKTVNIPVTGLTGNLSNVIQFKFDAGTGGTIYLDNLYFWKTPLPAGTDAGLSDLKVGGTTVSGFASNVTTYSKSVPFGSPVPQITQAPTSDPSANAVITQATAVPGSATVLVTSANGLVTRTYTVNYAFSGPTVPAPSPPLRAANDVISLFSNVYTNVQIDAWSAIWDNSDIEDIQINGNDVKKITFGNFLGVDFSSPGNHLNLTPMTRFHMDFYTESPNLLGKVFNSKIVDFGGTSGEVSAGELNINEASTPAIASNQWVSIDVPWSSWANNPNIRSDIAQFVITSNLDIVYVDNIYFYTGVPLPLDVREVAKSALKLYPNPAGDYVTLSSEAMIGEVTVLNALGQVVSRQNLAATEATIDVSAFSKGIYVVIAKVGNDLVRKQLIKK